MRTLLWAQRALIVLVATLPLLVVTLACVPALLVLPFRRDRAAHARAMVRQLSAWTRVLLLSSREH
ncbi:hypothetical protein PUR59_31120 [Streptomyces sp. SP18ES09]|uniref:hypothetical protein n=1 Tax=Streptomyces sp. SP18ES09 TaxID=3002532 RepID=UPI002E760023|nr:hypothetical protein [Streptomyces sp. SP18ES09]MEE1819456.1 hypothetical protein [Streptomyces sp. SP18ES09]